MIGVLKRERKKDVVASMFLSAAMVMIFTQLIGIIATTIDGIITSKFLGQDAYSSVSLLFPVVNTISLAASFLATGAQIICSERIGKGRKEDANQAFSFVLMAVLVFAAVFIFLCLTIPDTLFQICGISKETRPEIYGHMSDYLKGYMIGIPFVLLVQVLGPIAVLDNGKKFVTLSAVVLCIVDVSGDLLNAYVFKQGMFGMGLATSAAYLVQTGVLLIHFTKKESFFRLSFQRVSGEIVFHLIKAGSPAFIRRIATVLRDLLVNRLNIFFALSAAAIAARSLQGDLNMLMFSIGNGIGQTLVSMASLYYGAGDIKGLKRLLSYAVKVSVCISGAVGMAAFAGAKYIVMFYNCNEDTYALAIFAIRCMAAGLVFDTLSTVLQYYLQGIKNLALVNFMTFSDRFFIPVGTAALLGYFFGSKGVMASLAVGKLLLITVMFVVLCIRCKGLPKTAADFLFLPKGCGETEEENYYCELSSIEDVENASIAMGDFCKAHQISTSQANQMALFVEEMGCNIILHGKQQGRNRISAQLRVSIHEDQILLTLRDCCSYFDPAKYYEIHKDEDPAQNIGIRIVMKMADEVQYVSAFNSNNTMIRLKKRADVHDS